MYWDDDKIFMCSSRGYSIISKRSGDFIAKLEISNKATGFGSSVQNIASKLDPTKGFETFMAVNKGRCLVVTNHNKRAQFLEEGVSFSR